MSMQHGLVSSGLQPELHRLIKDELESEATCFNKRNLSLLCFCGIPTNQPTKLK